MDFDLVRNKRVLVTGGTGFVGSRVVPLLIRAGAQVTLLCRKTSHTENYPSSVRVLRTDLRTSQDFLPALCECDIFIHMAALLFGLGWQDYLRANCGAAENLASMLRAAGDRGPEKVILVSSLAAAGPCDSNEGRVETQPCEPVSAYGWSKVITENIFKAAAGDRLVILRPPIIYGSGDRGLLPVYRGLAKGVGAVPGLGRRFPVSILHVDDMAQAVFLACSDKAHGIYHLSDGDVWSMAEFYQAAASELGVRAHIFHLPLWFMGLTAFARAHLKYCHPLALDEVAADHPDTMFVMCHFGNPFLESAAAVVEKNPNVAADLSGLLEGRVDLDAYFREQAGYVSLLRTWLTAIESWDRILFGTDWPIVNLGEYIGFISWLVPERYHASVFFDNANRIYHLGL